MKKLLVGALLSCSMFALHGADPSGDQEKLLEFARCNFDSDVLSKLSRGEQDTLAYVRSYSPSRPGMLGPQAVAVLKKLKGLVDA